MKLKKSMLLIGICIAAVTAAGCGEDSDPVGPGEGANLPPAISGPESVNASVGVPVTFDVVATDPDGDEVDLTVSAVLSMADWRAGIRAGTVSIDAKTGEVTFTPNANDDPQRIIAVTAEDPSGESASIDVLVLVSSP